MTEIKTRTVFLTKDDLEVIDECLDFQLRTLRNKVVTTWKDKEFYDKVKALREEVEEELECFSWLTELEEAVSPEEKQKLDEETEERLARNQKNDLPGIRTRTFFPEEEVLGKTVDRLKVNTILLKKGILTKDIFKLAGLSEATYYKILTGKPVSLASKYKLAKALDVDVTEILKESEGANNE